METGTAARSLYGRERELGRIARFLERAATGPAALVLEGEPGVGKTTLWRAGVDAALESGCFVLQAQPAEAERELSFSALGDLLQPALGRLDELAAPRRRALEFALLLAEDEPAAPDALGVGLATLDVLRLQSEDGPLVIAIDDTQWLDAGSREALGYALRRLGPTPIAVLTARRRGGDARPLGDSEQVDVGPLSLGALHELLRERTGTRLARPTLVRVHETCGGNPFFALELVRALEGRDVTPGEPLPVPTSLRDLTSSRFERLGRESQEVLLYVAALARPTLEVVIDAAGERAGAAVDAAVVAGVLEAERPRLRFTHPLLASVLYGSASPGERGRVHRRLATVVTDAEERGRHLGAAATAPDSDVAAALDEAAAAARARGAPAAAAELAEIAVRRTPQEDSSSLLRRLCVAADHHSAAGSIVQARTLLESAIAQAPRGPQRARVALQLGSLLESQELSTPRTLMARALFEAEGDTRLRAEIHDTLARHLIQNIRESRRHAHIAFDLAEQTGDTQLIAEALALVIERDFWAGKGIDQALIARGTVLEEQLPQLPPSRRPSCAHAFALKWSGEIERASVMWERLRALGRSGGYRDLFQILFFNTYHELIAENWERAADLADEVLALGVEAEADAEVEGALWARVTVAAYRGQVDRARSDALEAQRLADAVGDDDPYLSGLARGVLELSVGESADALTHLRPSMEAMVATGLGESNLLLGFPEFVEAAAACGELDEATELLDFVEPRAQRLDRAWALGGSARGRALIASAKGDAAAAEQAFALAYEQHARRPQQLPTYELARTLFVHGSILRRQQQKRRAREALDRALAIFDRLGANVYAERARSELARIGGRALAAGDGLSETERRIADLVAQGRTNKEVAAALSLSPKTVEWNLSKVYAKLGIRSRAELAGRRR